MEHEFKSNISRENIKSNIEPTNIEEDWENESWADRHNEFKEDFEDD